MKISEKGLNLIREFEGCRLTAYKPVAAERYYTIGYGHYGADVHAGMRITQSQADAYLEKDVAKFVASVNALGRNWTQNQFDALVSFTYNCGAASLLYLTKGRNIETIAEKILIYNKGANGRTLPGLVRRRKAEHDLFVKPDEVHPYKDKPLKATEYYKIGHIYKTVTRMKIRKGPGAGYDQVIHNLMAENEKAYDSTKTGCLDAGTPVIPQDVKISGGIGGKPKSVWIKIGSGWVCGWNASKCYIR